MNYIRVDELKAGQEFTHPVFIEGDILFVPARVPIKEKDLVRLRSWKLDHLETEGMLLDTDAFDLVISELETQQDSPPKKIWGMASHEELNQFYRTAINTVDDILRRIQNMKTVKKNEIDDVVLQIIAKVGEKKTDAVQLVLSINSNVNSDAKNAVDSALLAVSIGMFLHHSREKLIQLCYGALLHDVGMQRIPRGIMEQKRTLSDDELKSLQKHVLHSFQIIKKELLLPEEVAKISLQHHERWDGKGYPQGLCGNAILFEARIISVVDSFEAMVSERPWRNSLIAYEAMRSIISDNNRHFDPEIVKIFIRSMGIYPVGSFLRLSDGRIARVIRIMEYAPLRPEVIILIDENDVKYEDDTGPVVKLLENPNLYIAQALGNHSFSQNGSP